MCSAGSEKLKRSMKVKILIFEGGLRSKVKKSPILKNALTKKS